MLYSRFISILVFLFATNSAVAAYSPFEDTQFQKNARSQIQTASDFQVCFDTLMGNGAKDANLVRIACQHAKLAASDGIIADDKEEIQLASWQWYICVENATGRGMPKDLAVTRCAALTAHESEAPVENEVAI